VAISVAPSLSGTIGENPDDLLSLSYHDDLPSPEAVAPHHGPRVNRGPVIYRPDS
jgi:hypothetical protein